MDVFAISPASSKPLWFILIICGLLVIFGAAKYRLAC